MLPTLVRAICQDAEGIDFHRDEMPVPSNGDLDKSRDAGPATPPRSEFHTDKSYVTNPEAGRATRGILAGSVGAALSNN